MPAFGAKEVQELRKSTGAGMMDAKRALTEADGDFEAATQILREKGLAKAATRSDRENDEGVVAVANGDGGAALVYLKSETDFAAKSDDFAKLATTLAELVLAEGPDAVSQADAQLEELKLAVKENIEVGAAVRYEADADSIVDTYLHGEGRAGVLIEATGVERDVLHEIALHIVFAKPRYLSRADVPEADVEKERAALTEITKAEGKPEQALPKIVEGRLNAWYGDLVLLEQGVLGEKETVADKIGGGSIRRFHLSILGG
ncbi:MAG: translation elongation factor Ts [Acidimicrobiales bacterium]